MLVFVNTRRKAEWLTNQVRTSMTPAVPCAAMHSDLDQQVCTALIEAFMRGELRMLIVRDEAIAPDGYVVRQSDYLAGRARRFAGRLFLMLLFLIWRTTPYAMR